MFAAVSDWCDHEPPRLETRMLACDYHQGTASGTKIQGLNLLCASTTERWGAQPMNSTKAAANRSNREGAKRNLTSISPFFIVKDLQASIAYYTDRLGFQLDFEGPADDPYYAKVSRDGIGIMLKAILPDVLPCPNHTRHEWARWDAYIYTLDPDALFDEFSQRGVSFVKQLSFIDEGLWGFELTDADGYVLAFFQVRNE
jgi:catechol 2,3-dioxygenase-like lactoylglutathione lyase family enzyme